MVFAPDGARFISASRDRTARVFDTTSGDVLATYNGHEAPVLSAAFPPQASNAISIARGQVVHQWDASAGRKSFEYADSGRGVQVFMPTEFGLLTGSIDGVVRLLQYSDRRVQFTFFGHRDCVDSFALAPDRRSFASGDHSGEVCVWNLACEAPVMRFVARP